MKQFFILIIGLIIVTSGNAQEFSGRYVLVKLNKEVNTFYHDAAPVISHDGKKLYFFIHNHPENTRGKEGSDDIWVTTLSDDGKTWLTATHLGSPFNIHHSNQVFTALPDGSLFIKGGRSRDEKGFSIVSTSGSLSELSVEGFKDMNRGRFYGASMSSDGKHMIIFLGEMVNSSRSNLYVSNLQPNGNWSRPQKLNISVRDDDFGPFIGPDDKMLYFASDRSAPGKKGKTDIYKCSRLDDTWQNWSTPVNMGSPINTAAEELYFCIDKAGNVFTSRSNSTIDGGNLDLYELIPRDINIVIMGTVFNTTTQQPLRANVEVKPAGKDGIKLQAGVDGKFRTKIPEVTGYAVSANADEFLPNSLSFMLPELGDDTTINVDIFLTPVAKKLVLTGVLTGTVFDQKTRKEVTSKVNIQHKNDRANDFKIQAMGGKYEQELREFGWYILSTSAEGYLNSTDSVEMVEGFTPVIKNIELIPIEVGVTVRLKNIYFDFDKTTLQNASFVELDKVVEFLKQNPKIEIEISGHTDSKGSDQYNLNLSQGRSQSVVDYIARQGIESFRLTARGYGESKPIDTNDTEDGRANNRRVEFTILKM